MQAKPKDGVFTKLDDKETSPSRCLSIFMYTFNTDGKINDIKFLRQPSKDETARKVWHNMRASPSIDPFANCARLHTAYIAGSV